MLALRLSPNTVLSPILGLLGLQQSRHKSSKQGPPRPQASRGSSYKPSLFEELFPDESRKYAQTTVSDNNDAKQGVPRLDLRNLEASFRQKDDLYSSEVRPQEVTEAAAKHAFRKENVAILALRAASKSLIESDFRRIAPKGKHIKDWTGPGNILKGE